MLKRILNKIRIFLFGSYLSIQEPEKIIEEMRKNDLQIIASQLKEHTQAIYSLSNKIKDLQELVNTNNTLLECIQNEFESYDEELLLTENKINTIDYKKIMEKIKYILKQIKNHAGLIVSLILLVLASFVSIILFQQKNKLTDLLEDQSKNYRKEIDDLRVLRDNELQQRIQIERRYQAELDRLNREHQINLENVDKDKEVLIKNVLKETKDSPEKAAQRINEIFGIPIHKEE